MKNASAKITLLTVSTLFLSINSHADFVSNDAKNLTHCNDLLTKEVGEVERTKTRNIKSKSKSFSVNYKVFNNGEHSTLQCKLQRGKADSITCLKGPLCESIDRK